MKKGFTRQNFAGQNLRGFTLIELLIVIGVIAALLAIAVIALNPGQQFAKANNVKRFGDVAAIVDAISLNIIAYRGDFSGPAACVAEFGTIPVTPAPPATLAYDDPADGDDPEVDICDCLVDEFLGLMPLDPTTSAAPADPIGAPCTGYDTGYQISKSAAGRITVSVPIAQIQDEGPGTPTRISATR